MKIRIGLVCILLMLAIKAANAQSDKELYDLAKNKLYNQLADSVLTSKGRYVQLYNGILESAFNKPANSNRILNNLNAKTLADSLQFLYRAAKYDNYLNLFEYNKAALLGDTLVSRDKKFYTSNSFDDLQADVNIWHCVAGVQPEQVIKTADTKIDIEPNPFGLKNIKVQIGNSVNDFIFDTGASISVMSESFAKKMGIKQVGNKPIKTRSISGNFVDGKMGVINELTVGNITVKNVLFYIFPDSSLTFANGALKIDAILGYPVIKEFGQFTQTVTSIFVPLIIPSPQSIPHNFIVQNQSPIIYLTVFNHELPFAFDTGDNGLSLNKPFYDAFKNNLSGTVKTRTMEGTGMVKKYQAFVADSITLFVNNQKVDYYKQDIDKDNYHILGNEYYGNIGQALISRFNSMTISFTNAQIIFK